MPCLLYSGISHVEVEAPNGYPVHNLDTELNYTSIQEAINAPETLDGHTIFVEEGTYFEHVTVDKSLTLLGEDREATIIDGDMIGNVVWITRDHVNIRGFTIRRSGQGVLTRESMLAAHDIVIYLQIVLLTTNMVFMGFQET